MNIKIVQICNTEPETHFLLGNILAAKVLYHHHAYEPSMKNRNNIVFDQPEK